ncbi:MAG: DUF4097 family beta strand repeat-containing protein, partial [Acidobacteria bacterium]|nr:DUF4097 family beta strand repeat-containing protein [Acidobacteriota bacterium]
MSWLYTLVFSGLLFSASGEIAQDSILPDDESAGREISVQGDEIEKFEQSYPLNAGGRVAVSNVNGSIVIEAWDRNEVRLEATKIADSKETLAEVEIKVNSTPDSLTVETDHQGWKWNNKRNDGRHRKLEVQFRLSVPRTARLDQIATVNGSVTVSNFVNYTRISAVNGSVSATNLRGTANLGTVNGEVMAEFDRLEPTSRISLNTVNGTATLMIPSDSNAIIKAESLNGNITNDFGLPVRKGRYVGRDLHGRVGTGETQIKLESVNGRLSVNRRNDGKSVNPATNLLQQKADDEDWSDGASAPSAAEVTRHVTRAARQAQRETADALREAAKELMKLDPRLYEIKAADLEKVKIDLDKKKIEGSIREAVAAQIEGVARLRDAIWTGPVFKKKTNVFSVSEIPKVNIDAPGCDVRVRGWDRDEVRYALTEMSVRFNDSNTSVKETASPKEVFLRIAHTSRGRR